MVTVAGMLHIHRPFFFCKANIDALEAADLFDKLYTQLLEKCSSSGEKPESTDCIFDDCCVGAIRGWLDKYPKTDAQMVTVHIHANDAFTEVSVEVFGILEPGHRETFCKKTDGFDAAFKEDEEKFISRFSLKKPETPPEPQQKVNVVLPSGPYEGVLSGEDLKEFRKAAGRACVPYTLESLEDTPMKGEPLWKNSIS
jgi:hypothetical protein